MTRAEFRRAYRLAVPQLRRWAQELDRLLREEIRELSRSRQPVGGLAYPLRVRLREARVKTLDRLYDKIENDSELEFERAFEPHHVHDLVGARLVCHNLADVIAVVKSIKKGQWSRLNYVEPEHGEKCWLDKANPETGYRGWHVDVRWNPAGSQPWAYAELQVRTILQDAHASFMHEDAFKAEARRVLPPDLFAHFVELGALLYPVDVIADRLRERVQEIRKVASSTTITRDDAAAAAMFFLASFLDEPWDLPEYETVRRVDTYVVQPGPASFSFEFEARCRTPEQFRFPLGGDTDAANLTKLRVSRPLSTGGWERLPKGVLARRQGKQPNLLLLLDTTQSAAIHHYRVDCVWGGVFGRDREYIWCPWRDLYGAATVDYELVLAFQRRPRLAPRLYRLAEFPDAEALCRAWASGRRGGLEPTQESTKRFRFSVKPAVDNYLCLFKV